MSFHDAEKRMEYTKSTMWCRGDCPQILGHAFAMAKPSRAFWPTLFRVAAAPFGIGPVPGNTGLSARNFRDLGEVTKHKALK